jgi:cell division protein FtsZ
MTTRNYLTFGGGAARVESGLRPVVRVVGVGGAGCNIVGSLADLGLGHVEPVAINTDAQSLLGLRCRKILIGRTITGGRGAAGNPAMGEAAVNAEMEKLRAVLQGTEVLFIICGLGGGTGTGAAPILACLGREMGALVVVLTVHPFRAEGRTRNQAASGGLERLRDTADVVVMVRNDKLVEEFPDLNFQEALRVADHLLLNPVKSIAQLLTREDLPNLRKVLQIRDLAHLGFGEASIHLGPRMVIHDAVSSLMPQGDISGHDRALAVIHCPPGLKEDDLHRFIRELHLFIHLDARIMWGPIMDPALHDEVRIMTIVGRAREVPDPPACVALPVEPLPDSNEPGI